MIHKIGDVVKVPSDFLRRAERDNPRKTQFCQFGFAIDDVVKEDGARLISGFKPAPRRDVYDFEIGDVHYEIKSTANASFTFSNGERAHHLNRLRLNLEGSVLFYVSDIAASTTKFIGSLPASYILNEGLFKVSAYTDNDGKPKYYIDLSHVEQALSRRPS